MAEQKLMASDIMDAINENKEDKKRRRDVFIDETLNSFLEIWKEKAESGVGARWIFNSNDPMCIQILRLNEGKSMGINLLSYEKPLKARGFETKYSFHPAIKKGFWIFEKTVEEEYTQLIVSAYPKE